MWQVVQWVRAWKSQLQWVMLTQRSVNPTRKWKFSFEASTIPLKSSSCRLSQLATRNKLLKRTKSTQFQTKKFLFETGNKSHHRSQYCELNSLFLWNTKFIFFLLWMTPFYWWRNLSTQLICLSLEFGTMSRKFILSFFMKQNCGLCLEARNRLEKIAKRVSSKNKSYKYHTFSHTFFVL
jgi:tRNA U54 and U55 pseudouridine synthase Pus10